MRYLPGTDTGNNERIATAAFALLCRQGTAVQRDSPAAVEFPNLTGRSSNSLFPGYAEGSANRLLSPDLSPVVIG